MSSIEDVFEAAQSLPSAERAQLITRLWDDLSADDWVPPSQAWIAEANRRSDAMDGGSMNAEPWSVVRERARRQAGLDG